MNLKELVLSLVNDCLKLKLNISDDYKEIDDLIADRCWSVSDYALCKTAVYSIDIKAQCGLLHLETGKFGNHICHLNQ